MRLPAAAVKVWAPLARQGLKAKLTIPTVWDGRGVREEKTRHYYSYLRNYIRSLADELKIEDEESLRDGERNYRVMKNRVNQKVMQGLTPGFLNEVTRRLGEDESTSGRAANDIMARINSKLFEQGYAFDLWSSLKDVVLSNGLDHANPGRSLAH